MDKPKSEDVEGGPFGPRTPAKSPAPAPAKTATVAAAPSGTSSYRIVSPYYRDGVYAPGGCVVGIPAEEYPAMDWTATDDPPDFTFRDTDEQKAARKKRQDEQELRDRRAAEVAARTPEVRAAAAAAHALAGGGVTPKK